VLAGLGHADPVRQTVLSYADEHARNESQAALRDLRARAEPEARKHRKE
jgi:hypothetical protein